MIDLHTHTTFSDGCLIPSELARRAAYAGYRGIAITDHADSSNLPLLLDSLRYFINQAGSYYSLEIIIGVEITHVPPPLIPKLLAQARNLGADIVVVHGETITEPVERGTNLAAIEGGADILAHPGLIDPKEAALAAELNVALEITTRRGHSAANGHVASLARKHGASLVINNDAHEPGDLVSKETRRKIALGAGLTAEEIIIAEKNSEKILRGVFKKVR